VRKLHIAGVAVAALAAVAFGAVQWIASRAHSEVMASIHQLRATGASVSHGAVNVNAWSRAVTIDALEILTVQEPKILVSIKSVAATGVSPVGAGAVAQRVVLKDISVGSAVGAANPAAAHLKIPQVNAIDFKYAPRVPEKQGADAITRGVEAFAALSAKAISIPTLTSRFAMPVQGPGGMVSTDIDYVYSDVDVLGLVDGQLGQIKAGKMTLAGTAGGRQVISGTIDGMEIDAVDLLPMFELGLDRRKADAGFYRMQGNTRIGKYTATLPDGGEISIGQMTASEAWIDPSKVSYRTFTQQLPVLQSVGPKPTDAQTQALIQAMVGFYEGVRFGALDMKDMRMKVATPGGPKADFAIAQMGMEGLASGKLKRIGFEGLTGSAPNARGKMEPFSLGLFALSDLDIAGLLKFAALGVTKPNLPPDKIMREVLPLLRGLELGAIKVPQGNTGEMIVVDQFKLGWGQFLNGIPSQLSARFKGSIPLDPADIRTAVFLQNGIKRLDADVDVALGYDEPKKTVLIEPVTIAVVPFGSISGRLSATQVPRTAFSFEPSELQAAAEKIELGGLDLKVVDGGAVALFRKLAGPEATAMVVMALQQQAGAGGPEAQTLQRIVTALQQFLETPNRTLSLRVTPKNPTPIMSLLMVGAMAGPGAVLAGLNVQVDVK
jgi:hypothetical protein